MILTPSNQTSLFGHGEIFNELYNLNENNTLPNKILLSGEKFPYIDGTAIEQMKDKVCEKYAKF